jgi:diacylglycerol kinase family enzyme
MHYYILDPGHLSIDKFEKLQIELQGYLTEFKISGEVARVTPLRSIADLVDTASQRGAKTLIACGTDDTFNLMLAALKGRDFTVAFIPLDENSYLSTILGVTNLYGGVKTVAARRIERMDLARIAGNYFISYLEFGILSYNLKSANWWSSIKMLSSEPQTFNVRIDDSYNLSINALGGLIANTRSSSCDTDSIANPTDGVLDLLILEKLSKTEILRYKNAIATGCLEKAPKTTVIKCKKVQFLEPKSFNLTMLGRVVAKFPAIVEIIPQRLKMIVGKNRTF